MSLALRPASAADRPALFSLYAEVQRFHHETDPKHFRAPDDDARFARFLRHALKAKDHHLFLAESAGEAVGYLELLVQTRAANPARDARRRLSIEQIVVGAKWRRRGFGRQMVAFARVLAEREGCDEVVLTVWTFNEDALAFYRAIGFRPLTTTLGIPPQAS